MLIWLVGWTIAGAANITRLFQPAGVEHKLFMLVWLIGWALGEGFVLWVIGWNLFGKEELVISPEQVVHKRTIFGRGFTREYDSSHVKNLRKSALLDMPFGIGTNGNFWGTSGGSMEFDYGNKSVSFGVGIESVEADSIVRKINDHLFSRQIIN
jgi:hypothetical protein